MRLPIVDPLRQRWETSTATPVRILRGLQDAWREDRVPGLASEIAFWGILSVFPGLLATAAALGVMDTILGGDIAERAQEETIDYLEEILTEEASGTINAVEDLFTTASPGLLTFGVLAALWAASRGFAAIIRALHVAYNISERRNALKRRFLAFGLAAGSVLVGALGLAMVVVGPLLGTGQDVADAIGLGDVFATLWTWIRWPVVLLIVVAWATTILHIAPNHKTPWRWDLPGAVLATVAWIVVSFGLRYYLSFAGEGNQVYGVLGGALIALFWLFLLAIGLVLGGELNAVLVQLGIAPAPVDSPGATVNPPGATPPDSEPHARRTTPSPPRS
jgi:membrane protein